jgi:hypothetical protein
MHALQGATYLSLFVTHPKCHFLIDAILALTRTFLPKEPRIAKLLEAHLYLQLPLDYSVLHIKNGPALKRLCDVNYQFVEKHEVGDP